MFESKNPRPTANLVLSIKEKAQEIVRTRGPLLPVQITKELGINVMFASALLSELVDGGILKLSHTKVGGSPVYYVTGQEPKLQALRDKLNDKQQKAFDILKQKKVLRDAEIDPVMRLALRDIKDFAHPLRVTSGNIQEIFWKWYLCSDSEAEPLIKDKLSIIEKEISKKQEAKESKDVQHDLNQIEKELKRLEEQKRNIMPVEQIVKENVSAQLEDKEEPKEEKTGSKFEKTKKKRAVKEKLSESLVQKSISETIVNEIDETDSFMMRVLSYFKENNIESSQIKPLRKESDFEGIIKIPTAVGYVTYFLKAKNKQKISDSDLSLLYVQAQMKKMPVLLVTTGNLTKKAQELLNKEFKNITIKQI